MDKRKKIAIGVGAACLVLLAALFVTKMRYESKVRGAIEEFLATLPAPLSLKAEDIDVSFFNKSVTLTNLKGSYTFDFPKGGSQESMPMDFAFGTIAASGVNIDGFKEGAGVAKLLDSLTITNATADSPIARSAIGKYALEGVTADFALVAKELATALPAIMEAGSTPNLAAKQELNQKLLTAVAGVLKAYETVTVKKATFSDYRYNIDMEGIKVEMVMESMEARDYSIRRIGPFALNNIKGSFNGAPFFEMASMTSEEIILPSLVGMIEVLAQSPAPSPLLLQQAFKDQPFAVKGLKVKGVSVRHPLQKDTVIFSLTDTDFNYAAETAHSMDFTFSELGLNKSFLEREMRLPPEALASLPEIITIDGAIQQEIQPKAPASYNIDLKKFYLKGTGLGEASFSFAADDLNTMAMMMGSPGNIVLKKIDLSLTDGGLSTIVFAANAHEKGISVQEAREGEVASLKKELETEATAAGRDVLTGLIQFLEQPGGTLRIVVAPPAPAGLDKLVAGIQSDPAALGLSVTVTPGR